jgi:energy-converting hydrogenase B subunit Q
MAVHALLVTVEERPGMMVAVTQALADGSGDIRSVDLRHRPDDTELLVECDLAGDVDALVARLQATSGVRPVVAAPSMSIVYGKRIVIIGGGAQVGQVALGAIAEADRHNIRGERISVDTIPLVGEHELATAVLAVVRLPRVRLLVLAGALMGGAITAAVEHVRRQGVAVISLNMAGSVPAAADFVVSDPVQAGVMAVMAVADTAKFDILRQQKRRY